MDCAICLDRFTPPIVQCVNGHSFCLACLQQSCSSGIHTCPSCRTRLPIVDGDGKARHPNEVIIRNRNLEDVVAATNAAAAASPSAAGSPAASDTPTSGGNGSTPLSNTTIEALRGSVPTSDHTLTRRKLTYASALVERQWLRVACLALLVSNLVIVSLVASGNHNLIRGLDPAADAASDDLMRGGVDGDTDSIFAVLHRCSIRRGGFAVINETCVAAELDGGTAAGTNTLSAPAAAARRISDTLRARVSAARADASATSTDAVADAPPAPTTTPAPPPPPAPGVFSLLWRVPLSVLRTVWWWFGILFAALWFTASWVWSILCFVVMAPLRLWFALMLVPFGVIGWSLQLVISVSTGVVHFVLDTGSKAGAVLLLVAFVGVILRSLHEHSAIVAERERRASRNSPAPRSRRGSASASGSGSSSSGYSSGPSPNSGAAAAAGTPRSSASPTPRSYGPAYGSAAPPPVEFSGFDEKSSAPTRNAPAPSDVAGAAAATATARYYPPPAAVPVPIPVRSIVIDGREMRAARSPMTVRAVSITNRSGAAAAAAAAAAASVTPYDSAFL